MRRLWIALAILPVWAGADTITLKFSDSSKRVIDVVASPTAKLSDSQPQSGPTLKVEASGDQWVRVYDPTTGNIAARKASDLTALSRSVDSKNEWTVIKTDYTRIGELRVRADQGGKPLALGSILIGDQTRLLTEESQGSAAFYGVPVGKVRISVSYRDGGETRTVGQGFDVPAVRDLPRPELVIVVPASNIEPAGGPTEQDDSKLPPPKPTPPPTGLLGNLIAMVLAGAAALAILYFGLRWIYGNQDKTKDALGKLGVQIPDPFAEPDPVPVASPMIPPAPAPTILLDPAPEPPLAPAAIVSGEPKLVGSSGSFTLSDGVHLVGREAGLTIALVGESTVSRQHAEIVCQGDSIIIRDLGSTNGTFVNGSRLTGDEPLRRGDRVQFGSVMFDVR